MDYILLTSGVWEWTTKKTLRDFYIASQLLTHATRVKQQYHVALEVLCAASKSRVVAFASLDKDENQMTPMHMKRK